MANERVILADSIENAPHLAAFDLLWAQRLSQIEIEQVLVYLIDTVTADALPYLAEQFDVAGYAGYKLATTEAQRREIIKQAIELKRYIGTVWAVRQAMISVGYGGALLEEGVDTGDPDTDWARFRVEVDLGNEKGLDGTTATELAKLINEYKNVRSHLLDISYRFNVSDVMPPIDDNFFIGFENPPLVDDLGWIARFHNGQFLRNGSITRNDGNDYLTVIIQ